MYEEVLYDVSDPVATITFNRPDRLNALTARTQAEFRHALVQAENDERVVGIVVTGAGRAFSAGADMQALSAIADRAGFEEDTSLADLEEDIRGRETAPEFKVTWSIIPSIRKPVIAAINGPVAGMSFAIATLCDIRFAAEGAVFTTSFSQRGLIAEHGLSWSLSRITGPSKALDLLWTARKFDADEAFRIGLVDRVVPPDELLPAARDYVAELARNCSPTSISIMKRQVYLHMMRPLNEAMDESNHLMADSLARPDFKEGVASFLEKRPPDFQRI